MQTGGGSVLHGWVVGGFGCAIVVVIVLGDAWPLSLSLCNTIMEWYHLRTYVGAVP